MTSPEAAAGKTVAITGSSGYIGATLLRHLEEYGNLDKLVAIDARPLPFPVHNVVVYRQNVRDSIEGALAANRVSTLVHLAFQSRPGRSQREANDIREGNLAALRSVLESCAGAGVRHVIFLSSHTVYGARPDNPVPLTVRSPLRAAPEHPSGYDQLLAERVIQDFSEHRGDVKITILRACRVLGPTAPAEAAQDLARRRFSRRWVLGVAGNDPPLQFLYQEDLARVLRLFIEREIPGVFNVAGDGVVFYREMAQITGSVFARLPYFLAFALVKLAWNAHLQRRHTTDELSQARYPMVMSTGALRQATGYQFWHTSKETLTAWAGPGGGG